MNFRAQGTLEYLIIIAVVVVIALAVSVVLLTQNENAILINEGLNQYPSTNVGGIVISDSVLSSTGDAVISLKNETGKDLNITQLVATSDGVDGNISLNCNGELRVGHEKNCLVLDVNTLCPCTGNNTVTCYYKIKYTYSTGLEEEKTLTIQNTCTSTAQTYTLNYTTTEGGTISGTTIQKIILGGNGTMVTAIPGEKFNFIKWSDGLATPTRTEYNVTENKNLMAEFDYKCRVDENCESYEMCSDNICVSREDGTNDYPFVINNCVELQEIDNNLTAKYVLGEDINCLETNSWNFNGTYYEGFEPIGESNCSVAGAMCNSWWDWCEQSCEGSWAVNNTFTGTLDGNGYAIKNLYINQTSKGGVGLFSTVNGTITNIGLIDANIIGYQSTGGIAGLLLGGGIIEKSYFSGNIIAGNTQKIYTSVGGIVGETLDGVVTKSYNLGNVTSDAYAGGIIGSMYNSFSPIINNVYNEGNISANRVGGGIVGIAYGTLENAYSTGVVQNGGGLVGDAGEGGPNWFAGFNINNSYWDLNTSNTLSSAGGEGKTTIEMTTVPNPENIYVDWNFTDIWEQENGKYPTLKN